MSDWSEVKRYTTIGNKALVDIGAICWSVRSCHDTYFSVYNANWEGHEKRGITLIADVGSNFAYLERQRSFSGNLKYNTLTIYEWKNNSLYSISFNLDNFDVLYINSTVDMAVSILKRLDLVGYLRQILVDWLKPLPKTMRLLIIKKYIPDYNEEDEKETIL
jgi:hypothetical protein